MNRKTRVRPSEKTVRLIPVVEIRQVSTPDALPRFHRAIDILLNSAEADIEPLQLTAGADEVINEQSNELSRGDKAQQ